MGVEDTAVDTSVFLSELERFEASFADFRSALLAEARAMADAVEYIVRTTVAFAAKFLKAIRPRRIGDLVYPEYPVFISDMKRSREFARKRPKAHCSSRDRYRSG